MTRVSLLLCGLILAGCAKPGDTAKSEPIAKWQSDQPWKAYAQCLGYELKQAPTISDRRERAVIRATEMTAATGGNLYPWTVTVQPRDQGSLAELRVIPVAASWVREDYREKVQGAVDRCGDTGA
jgi:hypothetical protein